MKYIFLDIDGVLNAPGDTNLIEGVLEVKKYTLLKKLVEETNSNVGVSFSGVAGPVGATKTICVGTVCIAFSINNKVFSYTKIILFVQNEINFIHKNVLKGL